MERKYFEKMNFGKHNLLFLLIFSIAVILLSFTYKNIVFNLAADEGLYLKYSTEVGQNGISAFKGMFKDYLSNPQNRITQNPLRVGYIILSSLWLRFFGYSISNLAYLSLFSYCIFLLLGFCFARKYLQPELAVIFILLLAFSPINMAMARRALIDSTFNLFIFSSIWLFFENIKKRNTLKTSIFIALYSFTILIKEGAAILSVFFVLYIFIRKLTTKADIRLTDILSVTIVPFMIAGFGYVILIGDLSLFFSVAKSVVTSPGVNAYAVYFCSGPWFRYLIDFIVLSPWVFILAVGFIFYYITGNEIREEIN
ncbi:glycosyltransferase family 39 protein, partial [Patescibacteria group bacterium]|nr:glycosyltransferase family 39 protein [Patescibacteria group bacterium]